MRTEKHIMLLSVQNINHLWNGKGQNNTQFTVSIRIFCNLGKPKYCFTGLEPIKLVKRTVSPNCVAIIFLVQRFYGCRNKTSFKKQPARSKFL